MPFRFAIRQCALLIVLSVLVSTPTFAADFASAYQDCLNAFKGQPAATAFCVPETCGYRACIAYHEMSLQYGDIVIPGGRLTTVPGECKPYEDVMHRCIVQYLNQAIPIPTPTPQPAPQGVAGSWEISQSNGYKGTLDLKQGPNGRLTGSASFNGGLNGTIEGTVSGHTVRFTVSYPGGIKGTYEGKLSTDGMAIRSAGTHSNTGESASWEAKRR